jgi:outer membrane biosynthesis protein TonB
MKKIIMSAFLVGMVSLFSAAQTKEPAKPVHAVHKTTPAKTTTPATTTTKAKTKTETTKPQQASSVTKPKHKKHKASKTTTKTSQ